jgi:hypothetical protein
MIEMVNPTPLPYPLTLLLPLTLTLPQGYPGEFSPEAWYGTPSSPGVDPDRGLRTPTQPETETETETEPLTLALNP